MIINLTEAQSLAISPSIPRLGDVATIKQMGDNLYVDLHFFAADNLSLIEQILTARYPGLRLQISSKTQAKAVQPNVTVKNNINNIIAVGSGKGGVGKSATTLNLALAMAHHGAKVGVLDADIYGPSLPTMLDNHQRPKITDAEKMHPHFSHTIESNSIGYLVDGDDAMIWRAPMITAALQQLINDTLWGSCFDGKLDYLFIDMPPGTGDIALTVAQQIPVTGAVTVTTPQDLALADAKRAINLFNKVQITNIGLVENMSTHICEKCGHESPIFGKHGGRLLAADYQMPFLGEIPLAIELREGLDSGQPLIFANPDHPISLRYLSMAEEISVSLAHKPKNFSQVFGKIAVENR